MMANHLNVIENGSMEKFKFDAITSSSMRHLKEYVDF